jgi:hypothetical protein
MNEHRVLQDRLIAHAAALRGIAESLRFRPADDVEVQAAVGVADLAASDLAALAEMLEEAG